MRLEDLKKKAGKLNKIHVIAILITTFAVSILLFNYFVVDSMTNEFEVTAESVESNSKDIGVVSDPKLDYGKTPAGSRVRKKVDIDSNRGLMLKISSGGNVSDYLDYPKIIFLEGDNQVEVSYSSQELGYYEGDLIVRRYTSDYKIGERWLKFRSKIGY